MELSDKIKTIADHLLYGDLLQALIVGAGTVEVIEGAEARAAGQEGV